MSHRVKDLLDEAAAGIEPRAADPVGAVVRRGRQVRLRAATAGALALVAVLTGGFVAGQRLLADPPHGAAARVDGPPTPELVDDRIEAGEVSFAVPEGWRVLAVESAPCGHHPKTVLLAKPPRDPFVGVTDCATADLEIRGVWDTNPYGTRVYVSPGAALPDGLVTVSPIAPRVFTLSGGEPGWLENSGEGVYRFLLPWSKVEVTARTGADVLDRLIGSITSGTWKPVALALPGRFDYAALTMPGGRALARDQLITDPAKLRRALDLLHGAPVVAEGDSCASPGQLSVRLDLGRFVTVRPAPAPGSPSAPPPTPQRRPAYHQDATAVVIALGGRCQEAVSARGGRVRLDDARLAELGDLFGVKLP